MEREGEGEAAVGGHGGGSGEESAVARIFGEEGWVAPSLTGSDSEDDEGKKCSFQGVKLVQLSIGVPTPPIKLGHDFFGISNVPEISTKL